jgi:excisionase family DNA binding protein
MAKQPNEMVMTIDDLAKYLKLSTSTLYKLCAEGKVPGQKVGKHWRFHKDVIDHWLGKPAGKARRSITSDSRASA